MIEPHDDLDRCPVSRRDEITLTAGWFAVIAWLVAPFLAWRGFWTGVSFSASGPTEAQERASQLYLSIAAILGIALPLLGLVLGRRVRHHVVVAAAVVELVAMIAASMLLIVLVAY